MKKLRVLIASAAAGFGDVRKAAMECWGFEVIMVPDGKQACATMMASQIDLCILDWELPKMSGISTCQWIRSVDLKTYPYIVLMTEKGRSEQVQAAYRAGANDYLNNPFNLEDLHFLVTTFAHKISQQDMVSREFNHVDPLEMYRRDLAPDKTSTRL